MINLIIGPKGSGKTKLLAKKIDKSAKECKGAVLCIKKGDSPMLRLPLANNNIRVMNTDDFAIKNYDELYGLISGAIASNFDIQEIFLDSTFKICSKDLTLFYDFIEKIQNELLRDPVTLTVTVSCEKEEISDTFVKTRGIKIISD